MAGMEETRHRFHDALRELEQKTLDGFEQVIEQLDRALESVGSRDVELAATVANRTVTARGGRDRCAGLCQRSRAIFEHAVCDFGEAHG